MKLEKGEGYFVIRNQILGARLFGLFIFFMAGGKDLLSGTFDSFGLLLGTIAGGILIFWPFVARVHVDARDRRVLIHRTSPLSRSVEQVPASAIESIYTVQQGSEAGVRYSIALTLESGERRFLTNCPTPVSAERLRNDIARALGLGDRAS